MSKNPLHVAMILYYFEKIIMLNLMIILKLTVGLTIIILLYASIYLFKYEIYLPVRINT